MQYQFAFIMAILFGCHGNVPWQIGKYGTDPSLAHKALSYGEKIAKIGPVNLEIFDEIRQNHDVNMHHNFD